MTFTPFDALMLAIAAMLGGIILLVRGGNWTIDSAVYIARRFGISPLVIGFTIVAFGTSLPELIVSVLANFEGSPGIALGNVLGSNIANILCVIALSTFFGTIYVRSVGIKRDLIMMLACTALIAALLVQGSIGYAAGGFMVLALVAYVLYQYRMALRGDLPVDQAEEPEFEKPLMAYVFLAIGLACVALGAEFLVRGAMVSASILGVPDAVIALSIIALGTSLPELTTCIVAVKKGHSDIVLGNIIGSNVFNILMIIGVTALVKPIVSGSFSPQLADFDVWVTMAVAVVFSALIFLRRKIDKPTGVLFLCAYVIYNIYIYAIYINA